jgi:hypothetical protein
MQKKYRMGLDMLREEARVNDARLSMAIDYENQLRKMHESAIDTLIMLRAAKRDIDARAESILSANAPEQATPTDNDHDS